ncbi:SDR family oxidoreductase [Trichocoleus desertorum AS-A10]|uniref:SDR family oxidoreductase n=1 Tax=Trichocoleus desertorum TaxID=1481672 RepID=UPI003296C4CF
MKAFVAGATGKTGRRIVEELLKRNIPVRALVRDLATVRDSFPPEVELVVGDVLKPDTLTTALGDSTVLLCATGARPSFDVTGPYKVDYEGTRNLVNAAKAHGIEHFVFVSSLCVSRLFHFLNLFGLILVWKKQAEQYLQQSGLTYTIVRPGGLTEAEGTNAVVLCQADTLFDGSIPRAQVAQVCVEALFQPTARNQIVEVIAEAKAPARPVEELFTSVA